MGHLCSEDFALDLQTVLSLAFMDCHARLLPAHLLMPCAYLLFFFISDTYVYVRQRQFVEIIISAVMDKSMQTNIEIYIYIYIIDYCLCCISVGVMALSLSRSQGKMLLNILLTCSLFK